MHMHEASSWAGLGPAWIYRQAGKQEYNQLTVDPLKSEGDMATELYMRVVLSMLGDKTCVAVVAIKLLDGETP